MDPVNATPQPQPNEPPKTHTITFSREQLKLFALIGLPIIILGIIFSTLVDSSWKKQNEKKPLSISPAPTEIVSTIPTTTPTETGDYKIMDGSVYETKTNRLVVDKKALVSESHLYTTEYVFNIIPSPDKRTLVLFTYGNISSAVIFLFDIKTEKTEYLAWAQEVAWSPSSRYLAYTAKPADIGPTKLHVYDLQKDAQANISMDVDENSAFNNLSWSDDSKTITSRYETTNKPDVMSPGYKVTAEGETKITVTEAK